MKNEIPIGDYVITQKIGKGSFSKVYKAYHKKTNKLYALKIFETKKFSEKILQSIYNEIKILMEIDHPNIVKLHETIKTKEYIYLVLDYCSKGDLQNYINHKGILTEYKAKDFFIQISKGLYYIWIHKLIHRDLKPHNILLTEDGVLKIADFGFAKHLEEAKMLESLCGSPIYMAPEILKFKEYDCKVDLWSMGVMLYQLLTNAYPFTGSNLITLLNNIENKNLYIPDELNLSISCKGLLKSLLVVNPKNRISFEKFFIHPFFNNYQFDNCVEPNNFILLNELIMSKSIDVDEDIESSGEFIEDDNYILVIRKDKTHLQNNNSELIETIYSIQIYLEMIYLSSSEVAFLGDVEEKNENIHISLPVYMKALSLYSHSIEVCNKCLNTIEESKEYLSKIQSLLLEKFSYILNKTEKIFTILSSEEYKSIKILTAEQIIYSYALEKIREAASFEFLEETQNAFESYVYGKRLLESLTMDKIPLDDEDSKIINNYLIKIKDRINYIQKK
jgi:serine/threonine protein kinase